MISLEIKDIYKDPQKYGEQQVNLKGWIRTIRSTKTFGFIELNDGSFFKSIQIVFADDLADFLEIAKLGIATAISVSGILILTPEAKQPFEVKAENIEIVGFSQADYPLQKKRHSFEFLRTIAHLRPRTNTFSAVFRIRSLAAHAIHSFLQEKGFVYVHTPIITGSDCEGAGEMFRVSTLPLQQPPLTETGEVDFSQDFFGRETNLTVSGQLAVEAYVMAFRKVYTFGPTFRAENSNTTRHAAEFWMVEPEIAFADLRDDMELAEGMMKYLINYIMEKAPEELMFFNQHIDKSLLPRLQHLVESDFAHITYTEAIDILLKSGEEFEYPVVWGSDLQTVHERYLTEKVFNRPVFVTDYPKEIKAFYMRMNDDGRTVAAMDLLVPGVGEIIGGSQREERLEFLEKRITEMGLNKDDYWWYLDLRKYGGTPHAGFGLGFERVVMYLTGMQNIRDVISYPRTANSAEF
ncbi:MAG: asparagine--tRNA ligase [Candidatus Cloacimonetes bacterium]|nr:asparagine--tRNA ligase [Candidatus Cloacimonadota bacterium]